MRVTAFVCDRCSSEVRLRQDQPNYEVRLVARSVGLFAIDLCEACWRSLCEQFLDLPTDHPCRRALVDADEWIGDEVDPMLQTAPLPPRPPPPGAPLTECVKHVREAPGRSWCGLRYDSTEWVFDRLEDAQAALHLGARIQPCMACLRAAEAEPPA